MRERAAGLAKGKLGRTFTKLFSAQPAGRGSEPEMKIPPPKALGTKEANEISKWSTEQLIGD